MGKKIVVLKMDNIVFSNGKVKFRQFCTSEMCPDLNIEKILKKHQIEFNDKI